MKVQDRKEKAFLHKALIDILTDCPNDMAYLKRLIFAQEIITNAIEDFTNEEYMGVVMELEKGQSNLTFPKLDVKHLKQLLDFFPNPCYTIHVIKGRKTHQTREEE